MKKVKNFKILIYLLAISLFVGLIPINSFAENERIKLDFTKNENISENKRANPRYLVELATNEKILRSSSKYASGFYFAVEGGSVFAIIPKRNREFSSEVNISSYANKISKDRGTYSTKDEMQKIMVGYSYEGGEYKMNIISKDFKGNIIATDSVTYSVGKDRTNSSDYFETFSDGAVKRMVSEVTFKKTESGYEITTPAIPSGYKGEIQLEVEKGRTTGRLNLKFESEKKTIYFDVGELDTLEASAFIKVKSGERTVASDYAYISNYLKINENKGFDLLNEASNAFSEVKFYMHEGRKFMSLPKKTENLKATYKLYSKNFFDERFFEPGDKQMEIPIEKEDTYLVATYINYDKLVLEKGMPAFGQNPFFNTDFPRSKMEWESFVAEKKNTDFKTKSIVKEDDKLTLSDIKGHWAESDIKRFAKADIVKGYPDGTFKPEKTLTRREALSVLSRVGRQNLRDLAVVKNHDVKFEKGTWGDEDVKFVLERLPKNIFGMISLEKNISREEVSYVISHLMKYTKGSIRVSDFKDQNEIRFEDEVKLLYSNGTIKGYPDGTFRPDDSLKRSEFVTMLSNIPRFTK